MDTILFDANDTISSQVLDSLIMENHHNEIVFKILNQTPTTSLFEQFGVQIVAVIIALIAVFVSWRVLKITRLHNQLSIKPYLIFRISTAKGTRKIRLFILNKGLGCPWPRDR